MAMELINQYLKIRQQKEDKKERERKMILKTAEEDMRKTLAMDYARSIPRPSDYISRTFLVRDVTISHDGTVLGAFQSVQVEERRPSDYFTRLGETLVSGGGSLS
jgi:hypothetical protein